MHDWTMWGGGGGMWLGPVWMVVWLVVLVVIVVVVVRWFGAPGGGERSAHSARAILDERYARGEIDRDEYMKRKQDIARS